ncbi:MAG: glycosyltransferase [Solirubrobacterales bacterium]
MSDPVAASTVRLSTIVPATNRPATLERCTEAIQAAEDPPDEVIVVDAPAEAGPAEARNAGARQATGEVLVFIDADVVVRADAFRRIRDAFERDQGLSGVFGSYDDQPEAPGLVSSFRNLLHHHVHQSSPGPATTFWAGLGAVRRDSFLAAGGFDERRYRMPSVEDIEFGMRLTAGGEKIILDPDLQGTHLKAWRLGQMVRTDFSQRGVPWIGLLLRDRGRASSDLNLGWRHRLSALVCLLGLAALIRRRLRVVVAMAIALVAINRPFYSLLGRRGPGTALAGVALHALHHLTAAAAVPVGAITHLLERRRAPAAEPEQGSA